VKTDFDIEVKIYIDKMYKKSIMSYLRQYSKNIQQLDKLTADYEINIYASYKIIM